MLQVGEVNSKVSEQPGQSQGKIYSMKTQNTTVRSYLRQKVDELSWLALPWYRTLNEVSENGTESRCPSRSALKTSIAIFHSTEEWIKSTSQGSNHSSQGKIPISHWVRASRCICHPWGRSEEMVWPLCIWDRKSLRAKMNISQKILTTEWLTQT